MIAEIHAIPLLGLFNISSYGTGGEG
jgi:hypothetical protein